jgi:hypothetical protein
MFILVLLSGFVLLLSPIWWFFLKHDTVNACLLPWLGHMYDLYSLRSIVLDVIVSNYGTEGIFN